MTSDSLGELGERIRHLARVPTLLVSCDYDGTLAPLVDQPMEARPSRDAAAAMRSLAELANTHVAVISGRSLRDLATLSRFPEEIRLVGSHGSEFELGFGSQLAPELVSLRTRLTRAVRDIASRYGANVEDKPTGVAFHFRGVEADAADAAREELVRGPAGWDGVHTRTGHDVLEMAVVDTNKGTALEILRTQVGATAVFFAGDDVTDEDAFLTLAGPDVGVKVGSATTAAAHRVKDTDTVAKILALLYELRDEWLRGAGLTRIEHHSIVSDLRTAAVISPAARVTWMCVPRIDSSAVFAELLGGPSAGHFSVTPVAGPGDEPTGDVAAAANGVGPQDGHQRYLGDTMVLTTTFPRFRVVDYLDVSEGRPQQVAGRSDLIRVLEGTGRAHIEFAPRLDFGRVPTQLELRPEGVVVLGSVDRMVLRAPDVEWELVHDGIHHTARGTVDLEASASGPVVLELRCGTNALQPDGREEAERRSGSVEFWRNWTADLDLPTTETELAMRSALAIKSLCHGPTGAIVAAVTTSLPEHLGGIRNWDDRYCWLRDAALSAASLVRLGSHREALDFLRWLLGILETRTDPERLAPVFNVTGRHLAPEAEIPELAGYGGSRPVRIGNAADGLVQLDVFGPIVDLVHLLLSRGETLTTDHWRLVETSVLAVSRRWTEPDHGIWQIRKPPRHHVYSKVMCWVTVDRAIQMSDHFLDRPPTAWIELRDQIAAEVLTRGWSEARGSFTAALESDDLDASVLAIGLWGLVSPTDDRFVSTVARIESELRNGPTVHRYFEDDGLPGREGGFNLMTSWLIDALALVGRRADAQALFEDLTNLIGPTGLMTEQFDPESGRGLGNYPQAYSHLGWINNAIRLSG